VNSEPLLNLARKLIGEVTFCVAAMTEAAGRYRRLRVQPPAIALATRAAWESHNLFL